MNIRPNAVPTALLVLYSMLLATVTVAAVEQPTAAELEATRIKDMAEMQSRARTSDPETWPGAAVYRERCAACHEGQVPKAPHKMFLQMMTPPRILDALDHGLMQQQAAGLSGEQRRHVSEYLASTTFDAVAVERIAPRCASGSKFDSASRPQPLSWGYDNSRFIPGDVAGLTRTQVPGLKLKWSFQYPGAIRARSQPSIAYGAVYTGSHDGTVYALDLATGCVRWTFHAAAEVRTTIVADVDSSRSRQPLLFFGDVIGKAYALDAWTGKAVWVVKVDDHPNATITGTPSPFKGALYVPVSSLEVSSAADVKYECCKFRGAVVALDAATGAVKWKSHTIVEEPKQVKITAQGTRVFAPSGSPVWNSPTIDSARGMLYVGTGENYSSPANETSDAVLAFRLSDGKLMWSRQLLAGDAWNVGCMFADHPNCPAENGPDLDVAAGTILTTLPNGKPRLLVGQKSGMVFGLDPADGGRIAWQTRVGRGGIQGGVHFGMARDGSHLFVPIVDMKDGRDGRAHEDRARPGLYALDVATGKFIWSSPAADVCKGRPFCDAGISAAVTALPGVVFAGHMDGWLRAYDSSDGKVIWQFDSTQPATTVSGAVTHGGSFGSGGVAIRDGYVAVNSGYGIYFHMPGGILLVFAASP